MPTARNKNVSHVYIQQKYCKAFDKMISHVRFCANGTVKFVDNPLEFNKPGIGLVLLYMFVEGIVFFILTLFIQVCLTFNS